MSPLTQGAELTSEPFPSLIFSFTSGEVCLMTWVKTADTSSQGGRHCSVFHSNSTGQLSFDVSTSLLWWFLFDQSWLSALFHVWGHYCLFAHKGNTRKETHFTKKTENSCVASHLINFCPFFLHRRGKKHSIVLRTQLSIRVHACIGG